MKASLRTSRPITTRLLVLVAVLAAAVAAVSAPGATAASTASYWATFPPGECAGNTVTVFAPYSVSSWAGDAKIAWRAHIWRNVGGTPKYESSTSWQWANVVGGQVYAPYGQSGSFTINWKGVYKVSVEIYSYGLGRYFNQWLPLRVSNWLGQQWEGDSCQF
jgi:hypothetical protein